MDNLDEWMNEHEGGSFLEEQISRYEPHQENTGLPDKDASMEIFKSTVPYVRSNELYPESSDGVITGTAQSLDMSLRHLRRIANKESPFLKNHFQNLDITDRFNDITNFPEYQTISKVEDTYNQYMSQAVKEAKDTVFDSLQSNPRYRELDTLLFNREITPEEIGPKREAIQEELLREASKDLTDQMFAMHAPKEQLYAKAIELGKSDMSYKEAQKEFESFYLQLALQDTVKRSSDYTDFCSRLTNVTGYSPSYLTKKVRTTFDTSLPEYFGQKCPNYN
ncbi:MAG: hypothetical protein ACLFP2_05365 [Candidatus Woesearchaeota archaeon]